MDDIRNRAFLEEVVSTDFPKSILGYASALDRIVKYMQQNPSDMPHANMVSIIAISKSLDHPTRKVLSDLFNCPIVSRFANTECGMLVQQTADLENDFLLNLASNHIEVLHLEKDVPTEEGEPITSFTITNNMWKYIELTQYQFIQLSEKIYKFN